MADEVHIKVTADTKDTKKAAQDFVTMGKAIETMRKQEKISVEQASKAIQGYLKSVQDTLPVTKATINAQQSLWHQNNRVTLGFKSLATEVVTVRDRMRDMLQEQRLGNRIMSESMQSFRGFTSIIGGTEISNAFNTVINQFQSTEFAIQGIGTAAQEAGGKTAQFAQTLVGMGAGLIAPIALAVSQILLIKDAVDKTKEAIDKYREAAIKAGIINEREELAKEYGKVTPRFQGIQAGYIQGLVSQFPWLAALLPAAYSGAAAEKMGIRAKMQPGFNLGGGVSTAGIVLGEETITGTRGGVVPEGARYGPSSAYQYGLEPLSAGRGISGGIGAPRMAKPLPSEYLRAEQVVTELDGRVRAIGGVLTDALTQGFVQGFSKGNDLLTTFRDSVLAAMGAIAAQQVAAAGIAGIISLIPGAGTFGTIFGALGGLFGGKTESSTPSPLSSVDVSNSRGGVQVGLARIENAVKNLELRVDNQGIYMASERGRATFERAF